MRNSLPELVFALVVLCLAASGEEILPKFFGAGIPLLLAAAQVTAVRRPVAAAVVFAIAAGAIEDSLSSLPAMTSVSFFLMAAAFARRAEMPVAAALLTYPAYQVWLSAWTGGLSGGVFMRILVAVPLGAATSFAAWWALLCIERRAALGEQD